MSIRLDLDSFDLASVKDNIRIRVFPSAWLKSASSDTPIDCTSDAILSGLEACDSWICRSHACRLELCLTNLEKPERHDLSPLFQTVVQSVVKAKLWKQLDLRLIPLVSFEDYQLEAGLYFAFRIEHQASDASSSPRRLHSLLMDDSATDLRPPNGINPLLVESYQILLDFSRQSEPSQSEGDMHISHLDGACDAMGDLCDYSGAEVDLLFDLVDKGEGVYQQTSDTSDVPGSCLPSKPLNALSCGDQAEDLPTRDWLTPIIDAALRSTIYTTPRRLHAGWRLQQGQPRSALQDIAPAMWAPDYLLGMAERGCFIPTLTHAISHSIPSRARSASLAQQLRQLQPDTSEQPITSFGNACSQSSRLLTSTTMLLWREMHQNLLRRAGHVTLARITSIVGIKVDAATIGERKQHHIHLLNQDYYYPLHQQNGLEDVIVTDLTSLSPIAEDLSPWTSCQEHDDITNISDEVGILPDPEEEHFLGFDYYDDCDNDDEELLFPQTSDDVCPPVEDDLLFDQCELPYEDDPRLAATAKSHGLMAINTTDDDLLDLMYDLY